MRDWLEKLNYYHPVLVTLAINLSQVILVPMSPQQKESKEKPAAPFRDVLACAFFNFANHSSMNAAYIGLPGSILNMMKGLKQIFIVLLSIGILGKRLKSYQTLGFFINLLGIGLIGYVALSGETGWSTGNNAVIAFFLAVAACWFGAVQNVWEEKTMRQYTISPELLTGLEGVYGAGFGVIVLVFLNLFHEANTAADVLIMWRRTIILCIFLGFLVVIPPNKYGSRAVTCYNSAIMKGLIEVARVSLVWMVELLCGWDRFSWTELVGFVTITLGTMVYGKMVKVPCLSYEEEPEERKPLLSNGKFEGSV